MDGHLKNVVVMTSKKCRKPDGILYKKDKVHPMGGC